MPFPLDGPSFALTRCPALWWVRAGCSASLQILGKVWLLVWCLSTTQGHGQTGVSAVLRSLETERDDFILVLYFFVLLDG